MNLNPPSLESPFFPYTSNKSRGPGLPPAALDLLPTAAGPVLAQRLVETTDPEYAYEVPKTEYDFPPHKPFFHRGLAFSNVPYYSDTSRSKLLNCLPSQGTYQRRSELQDELEMLRLDLNLDVYSPPISAGSVCSVFLLYEEHVGGPPVGPGFSHPEWGNSVFCCAGSFAGDLPKLGPHRAYPQAYALRGTVLKRWDFTIPCNLSYTQRQVAVEVAGQVGVQPTTLQHTNQVQFDPVHAPGLPPTYRPGEDWRTAVDTHVGTWAYRLDGDGGTHSANPAFIIRESIDLQGLFTSYVADTTDYPPDAQVITGLPKSGMLSLCTFSTASEIADPPSHLPPVLNSTPVGVVDAILYYRWVRES